MKTVCDVKIDEIRYWDFDSVRDMCLKHNLYSHGNSMSYSEMLSFVESHEPTKENIYLVACDILDNSENQTINNIMYLLHKEAVEIYLVYDRETVQRG